MEVTLDEYGPLLPYKHKVTVYLSENDILFLKMDSNFIEKSFSGKSLLKTTKELLDAIITEVTKK
jgi:hypothetical protein